MNETSLQERCGVTRNGREVFVRREDLTIAERLAIVVQMRREAEADARHADALDAENRPRRKRPRRTTMNEKGGVVSEGPDCKRYAPVTEGPATPEGTEDGIALALAFEHAANLRYIEVWRSWYVFDGERWERDQTGRVFNLVRRMARTAAPGGWTWNFTVDFVKGAEWLAR